MKNILIVLFLASGMLGLLGCASSSKDISSTYVSPLQYKEYSCDQVTAELDRVTTRSTQLGGKLDQAAANDKKITGAGALIFWPALFALGGNKEQEAEYSKLRGEHDALSQVAVQKNCLTSDRQPAQVETDNKKSSANGGPTKNK